MSWLRWLTLLLDEDHHRRRHRHHHRHHCRLRSEGDKVDGDRAEPVFPLCSSSACRPSPLPLSPSHPFALASSVGLAGPLLCYIYARRPAVLIALLSVRISHVHVFVGFWPDLS